MAISDIKKIRLEKLGQIKKAGVNPYPIKTKRTHSIEHVWADFDEFSQSKEELALAGRIMAQRGHGGLIFFDIDDGSGKIQAALKKNAVGEKTLQATGFRMLSKSLLPLPEKWHVLQDTEERFRKRYLDLIMNSEVRDKFRMRSKIVEELRNILNSNGFLEVETPILQPIPGGARAKPFKTRLNALKMDLYLRVSPELYLKRLLIGGFEKVYEIGRCFRNEGM